LNVLNIALFHRGHFDHHCILQMDVHFNVVCECGNASRMMYSATKQGLDVVCCSYWYCM